MVRYQILYSALGVIRVDYSSGSYRNLSEVFVLYQLL